MAPSRCAIIEHLVLEFQQLAASRPSATTAAHPVWLKFLQTIPDALRSRGEGTRHRAHSGPQP
jgi:hypothetical protein